MSTKLEPTKALVILSGGQDSTTCLAVAKESFDEVHAITFNYGQRHAIEIESAIKVAEMIRVASHEIINMGVILKGRSPLVSENEVKTYDNPEQVPDGIAETFVPSRNALFITIASNRAVVLGASVILTGVSQTDYSGYPDCRRDFIDQLESALSLANFGDSGHLTIKTPLMFLTKAESVLLAKDILGDRFDEVFLHTHTCYRGVKGGCGQCAACLLRDRGFAEALIDDPIWALRQG